jgi:hypothetical protein
VASGADVARARAGPIREGGGAVSALALTCSARGELMILILSLQIKECLSRKLSLGSFGSDFFDISGRLLVKIEAPWQGTLDLNAFFYIAGTYKSTRHAHSDSAPLFSISCTKKIKYFVWQPGSLLWGCFFFATHPNSKKYAIIERGAPLCWFSEMYKSYTRLSFYRRQKPCRTELGTGD